MMKASPSLPADLDVLEAQLTPESPLWQWAYDAIVRRADTMLEHVEGVRLGEDIEAVHDMRVGSRRLVAAMRVFESCFPGKEYQRLLKEARRVTQRLGSVRDFDVLLDHFTRLRRKVEPEEQLGIDYFVAVKQRERRQARKPMLASLDEVVKSRYPERLREFLRQEAEGYALSQPANGNGAGPQDRSGCPGSFRSAAPGALAQRSADMYAFEQYVDQPDAVEELHEMRIKAKWLRYTMELFAPAYADELKGVIDSVKKIQERLGDLHDADIRVQILGEMLAAPLEVRGLEAVDRMLPDPVEVSLRRLHEREARVRQECYRAFVKDWKKLEQAGFAAACLARIQNPDAAEAADALPQ